MKADTLDFILRMMALSPSSDFLKCLTQALAEHLQVKCIFICIPHFEKKGVASVPFLFSDSKHLPSALVPLEGSPCQTVVNQTELIHYPRGLQERFPQCQLIQDFDFESYVAQPIFSEDRTHMGHIVIADKKPLLEAELREKEIPLLLQTLSARVAAELQRISSEQKFEKTHQDYQILSELTPVGIMKTDLSGICTYVNRHWSEMTGLSPQKILGKPWIPFVHEEDRDLVQFRWKNLLNKVIPFQIEFRFDTPEHDTWVFGQGVRGDDHIVMTLTNITDLKSSQIELRRSESRLRLLYKRLVTAQEKERKKITIDLHDEIAQILTTLKTDILWLKDRTENSEIKNVGSRLNSAESLINRSIDSVSRILAGMRPAILEDLGLIAATEDIVKQFRNRNSIQCHLHLQMTEEEEAKLSPGVATTLYRVLQEALTNVIRHADARNVWINLNHLKTQITLQIRDDGKGIQKENLIDPNSLGLESMKERVRWMNGIFEIQGEDQGTSIQAILPIETI